MEVKRGNVLEQPHLVEIAESCERRDVLSTFDERRAQTPLGNYGDIQCLHQRARVLAESLLTRNETVAVVLVFHLALREVITEAHIVVRADYQASAFTLQPFLDGRDFFWRCLLLGEQVI